MAMHPTMKPVELIRRPILWHTRPGELIYEPFSGIGTAIIAAEQTGRRCYAMELVAGLRRCRRDPLAALHRQAGHPEGDGRGFAELALERAGEPKGGGR